MVLAASSSESSALDPRMGRINCDWNCDWDVEGTAVPGGAAAVCDWLIFSKYRSEPNSVMWRGSMMAGRWRATASPRSLGQDGHGTESLDHADPLYWVASIATRPARRSKNMYQRRRVVATQSWWSIRAGRDVVEVKGTHCAQRSNHRTPPAASSDKQSDTGRGGQAEKCVTRTRRSRRKSDEGMRGGVNLVRCLDWEARKRCLSCRRGQNQSVAATEVGMGRLGTADRRVRR